MAKPSDVLLARMRNQGLAGGGFGSAEDAVRWFGAVQGQDVLASLWALGLRVPGSTEDGIEGAVRRGHIVRTWPMRGTVHYVPAEDARWMLDLMTPRTVARSAKLRGNLGLDEKAIDEARGEIRAILEGGRVVTRADLMRRLGQRGIPTSGQRGYQLVSHLAQTGFLCIGPREGKQPTLVLLDEWVPEHRELSREEGLAEMATRYFRSHGPATLHDFAWWTGLTAADCKAAMDSASPRLERWKDGDRTLWHMPAADGPGDEPGGVMLLPFVDEYTVGYRDRSDFLDPRHAERTFHGLMSVVTSGGKIVGMWRRELAATRAVVELDLFRELGGDEERSLDRALRGYGAFLGRDVELSGA